MPPLVWGAGAGVVKLLHGVPSQMAQIKPPSIQPRILCCTRRKVRSELD